MGRVLAIACAVSLAACTVAPAPQPDGEALSSQMVPSPAVSAIGSGGTPTLLPVPSRKVVGYYTSWSIFTYQYFVPDIPAEYLTHLIYAFADISPEGECIPGDVWADLRYMYPGDHEIETVRGNFKQLGLLKEQYPHLKTLISTGGWIWSDKFSGVAASAAARNRFARSCVALMQSYGFDGIDIDWQFPVVGGPAGVGSPEDTGNFTLLLAELRRVLDEQEALQGEDYLLTIAAPARPSLYRHLDLAGLHPSVDWISVQAFSYHVGQSGFTRHHAPLYPSSTDPDPDQVVRTGYNVDATIRAYLAARVPPEKLVLGVPFYGHGWEGADAANNGLFQPFEGLPDRDLGEGVYAYRDLSPDLTTSAVRYWDEEAQAAWLYDSETGTMVSYEDVGSITAKARYVDALFLGGMMAWELGFDDAYHTLLRAIYLGLQE